MSRDQSRVAVVTGGAGFIGSHMVDLLLEKGFQVRAIDDLTGGRIQNLEAHRANPDFVLDTRDIRTLEATDSVFRGAKYVFHFAGKGDIVPSIEQPVDYVSVNLMGTIRVLEGARAAGVQKLVYAASSSCYGVATELPTTENAPIRPEYPYALSKLLGEEAVFHWGQVYRLPMNSIRIFNAYGTRARTSGVYGGVFGVFLAQLLAGKPLTVVGDGSQTRDFVYVTDVARAFLAVAEKAEVQEMFNLGASQPQSVKRLVELIQPKAVVYLPKRPGEPDCTWADNSKLRSLGWSPRVSFEEGVGEMLRNIEYWRDAPVWDTESIAKATATWFEYLGANA